MIKSFKCKKTELLFESHVVNRKFFEVAKTALIKLELINASSSLQDLTIPPSNKLEKLYGDRKNSYSIRINDKWRICFYFRSGNAYEVEIVDYH